MREKNVLDQDIHLERVSSMKTEALFLALMLLFLALTLWRFNVRGWGVLTAVFLILCLFFLFYTMNYRVLIIHLTPTSLVLQFGLFTWTITMDNIESCYLDNTSLWRIGGAGIHFSWFNKKYRAMFNFLEYSRVIVVLRHKRGPVKEIAFSTQRPDQVLKLIQETAPFAEQKGC
jgi:hypothetical protein